jgi:hypothetical protein
MLGANNILALNETTGIVSSRYVFDENVAVQRPKQRDPITDEHWNARDYEASNQAGLQKPLNCDATIHVDMPNAASCELRYDIRRSAGHLFHHGSARNEREGTTAEYEDRLLSVGPAPKA